MIALLFVWQPLRFDRVHVEVSSYGDRLKLTWKSILVKMEQCINTPTSISVFLQSMSNSLIKILFCVNTSDMRVKMAHYTFLSSRYQLN